jgi:hypothetical protein
MKTYYANGRIHVVEKDVNYLLHIIIFVGILSMFIFGIWDFAHAPKQPKASITINDTLFQGYDKEGNIIYENNNYWCVVK